MSMTKVFIIFRCAKEIFAKKIIKKISLVFILYLSPINIYFVFFIFISNEDFSRGLYIFIYLSVTKMLFNVF